jgi:hypothetical protein
MNRRFLHPLWAAVCVAVLVVANGVSAQQSQLSPSAAIATFFYKDPRPERLVGFFEQFESAPTPRRWESYVPLTGLFAVVFRAHPTQIGILVPTRPSAKAADTINAALILSGNRSKIAQVSARLDQAGSDEILKAELAGLPERLEDLRIQSPIHMNILWGAAFASGDERFVRTIIEFFAQAANISEPVALDVSLTTLALMSGAAEIFAELRSKYDEPQAVQIVLAATALWALESNRKDHEFVERAVTKYVQDHSATSAAKALSAFQPK